MKITRRRLAFALLLLLLSVAALAWWQRGRVGREIGVRPPTGSPGRADVSVPPGFAVTVFAENLADPRFMAIGPDGNVYVAERGADRVVALPDANGDGRADRRVTVADGLNAPSSLDFRFGTDQMYVGETDRVSRFAVNNMAAGTAEVIVNDLPPGGSHTTRTVLIGPDDNLYVSIGSSCNVCIEEDSRRAAVMVYEPNGGSPRLFAGGLRNAVGLTVHPDTGHIWATNNGSDLLGNDRPPDTLHRLEAGMDAGWPRCHAGAFPDPDLGSEEGCGGVNPPEIAIQAHSAPLGLTFYDSAAFPIRYRGALFVALHGSWNRYPPTGYKVVAVPFKNGRVTGPPEDFATGWLTDTWDSPGRPVGVVVAPDGALLVSDDKGGFIYRIAWTDED